MDCGGRRRQEGKHRVGAVAGEKWWKLWMNVRALGVKRTEQIYEIGGERISLPCRLHVSNGWVWDGATQTLKFHSGRFSVDAGNANEMAETGRGTNMGSKGEEDKWNCKCDVWDIWRHLGGDRYLVGSGVYGSDPQKGSRVSAVLGSCEYIWFLSHGDWWG